MSALETPPVSPALTVDDTYCHQRRVGDFLFWDNIVLQHARTDFDPTRPRTLYRSPALEREEAQRFPHSRDMSLAASA
jgi:alpha-ketoglutarate-dependent taurine dioxygenase